MEALSQSRPRWQPAFRTGAERREVLGEARLAVGAVPRLLARGGREPARYAGRCSQEGDLSGVQSPIFCVGTRKSDVQIMKMEKNEKNREQYVFTRARFRRYRYLFLMLIGKCLTTSIRFTSESQKYASIDMLIVRISQPDFDALMIC